MWQPNLTRYLPAQVELSNTIRRIVMDHNRWVRTLISRIYLILEASLAEKRQKTAWNKYRVNLPTFLPSIMARILEKRFRKTIAAIFNILS